MADDDQKLTDEQVQKGIDWIKEKSGPGRPKCPSCGNNSWHIANDLVAPPILNRTGGMILGGRNYPQVMIMCRICAHSMFFNAVMIGMTEEAGKENDEEKEKGKNLKSKKEKKQDVKKQGAKNG